MIGILKGMAITIRHAFRKPVTFQYPSEKRSDIAPRFRGEPRLTRMMGMNGAGPETVETDKMPPCMATCPSNMKIREYVGLVAEGRYLDAVAKMKEDNPLPLVCGHVCPHPCESQCRRGDKDEPVGINPIKRFAADYEYKMRREGKLPKAEAKITKDKSIAIIGAGPAGLTCAYYLAKSGYPVTIFEKLPVAGGMLAVGIPDYRLPQEILKDEIDQILDLGVELRLNTAVEDLDQLFRDGFSAVFLGVGAHKPMKLGIEGEDLKGVIPGEEFLKDVALGSKTDMGKKVAVIGGGNTAVDCARVSLREGAKKVYILYRRTQAEMPAHEVEIEDALAEGVDIQYLVAPTRITGKRGRVSAIECQRMELGEKDRSGRRRPVPIEGCEFTLDVDTVMSAISRTPDVDWLDQTGVELHPKRSVIVTDKRTGETSRPGVFAGGDVSLGADIAIAAIGMGKRAAISIDAYLSGQDIKQAHERGLIRAMVKSLYLDEPRHEGKKLDPKKRIKGYDKVELGLIEEQALREARRCLSCETKTCIGCSICADNCPTDAISIQATQDDKRRTIESYTIDIGRCIFCGICVEACPTKTLYHSGKYELAEDAVAKLIKTREYLLRPAGTQEEEIVDYRSVDSGRQLVASAPRALSQPPDGTASRGGQTGEKEVAAGDR